MNEHTSAVRLENISKQYPNANKKANNNISLELNTGEILCIAGENGAGKTTLMKILCGLEKPNAGEIFIFDKKASINTPLAAKSLGLGMVHQHCLLFPEYTVAENITMGNEPRKFGLFFDRKKSEDAAKKVIEAHDFKIDPGQKVKDLSIGQMQQVEICRLLFRNTKIIVLDEPTSVLNETETLSLIKTLKSLASAGKSIILITHKLKEIKLAGNRVTVLRDGELIGTKNVPEIDEYEIAGMMVGKNYNSPIDIFKIKPEDSVLNKAFKPIIVFDNVTVNKRGQKRPLLDNISFSVSQGEIIGFAGVGGNGLGVMEAVLGGFLHPASGKITHNGNDISKLNIRRLRNQGLAYVPADRLNIGSAQDATVVENIVINHRKKMYWNYSLKQWSTVNKIKSDFVGNIFKQYNIQGDVNGIVSSLSGGNLQKLILAREIDRIKDYIIFSEPTWGLDITARDFAWNKIIELRNKGTAIILISTNLDEIITLSDRIMVMFRGKIAGVFINDRTALTKENVGRVMQGLT